MRPMIGWTLADYYYYICFSIFNMILFTLLLTNMAFLPPKYKSLIKQNKWAIVLWITLIIWPIFEVFVNTSIIYDYPSKCYEQDISCNRCSIGAHGGHLVFIISIVARLFCILRFVSKFILSQISFVISNLFS